MPKRKGKEPAEAPADAPPGSRLRNLFGQWRQARAPDIPQELQKHLAKVPIAPVEYLGRCSLEDLRMFSVECDLGAVADDKAWDHADTLTSLLMERAGVEVRAFLLCALRMHCTALNPILCCSRRFLRSTPPWPRLIIGASARS